MAPRGITINIVQPGPIDTDAIPEDGPMKELMHSFMAIKRHGPQKSLSVEKQSIKLPALIAAMFYDLSDKPPQIPKQGERRERELRELVKKGKQPIALFVDEAHDLTATPSLVSSA